MKTAWQRRPLGNITLERIDFPMIDACPDPKRQEELSKRR
jgi:hypothetical protein